MHTVSGTRGGILEKTPAPEPEPEVVDFGNTFVPSRRSAEPSRGCRYPVVCHQWIARKYLYFLVRGKRV